MDNNTAYALIHSPLVGILTWEPVAHVIQQQGYTVVLPVLSDHPDSPLPFWQQHVEAARPALTHLPESQVVTLVAHSGAGPLLPAIRQSLPNRVNAYVFVDAGIPRDRASRLDLMKAEDPDWAEQFHQELLRGGRFPIWSADDLREVIPDDELRQRMAAEIHARALPFFTEPIPVFAGWPDAPCAYIQFSAPYARAAEQARRAGWLVEEVEAGHFHMLVAPSTVANLIVKVVRQLEQRATP